MIAGVDAGGTRTVAAVERDGGVATSQAHAAANPRRDGVERAADAIASALASVAGGAPVEALVAGVAGAGDAAIARALEDALRARTGAARVSVVDDAKIALRGAVPEGDGVVLVAGTGSIAYAEVEGRNVRAGGYGYAIGDEGSGYALGNAALRLLLRAFEGRVPKDSTTDAVAEAIGAHGAGDVVAWTYGSPSLAASVASLAPIVIERAACGERSAAKIVQTAATDLYDLLRAVWRLGAIGERAVPIAFGGALLAQNSMLTYLIETRIAGDLPHAWIVKGGDPLRGALALARTLAGRA